MKEHVPRYHQLRVKKYFTCGASFTENAIIIPRICSFCNFFENPINLASFSKNLVSEKCSRIHNAYPPRNYF